jgi:hypothetical protein
MLAQRIRGPAKVYHAGEVRSTCSVGPFSLNSKITCRKPAVHAGLPQVARYFRYGTTL